LLHGDLQKVNPNEALSAVAFSPRNFITLLLSLLDVEQKSILAAATIVSARFPQNVDMALCVGYSSVLLEKEKNLPLEKAACKR